MVKEIAHKGTAHHDDQGEDQEEQAGVGRNPKAPCVHRNEREDAAIGKEDQAAQDDRRKGFLLKEVREMDTLASLFTGLHHRGRERFPISGKDRTHRETCQESEEDRCAEGLDDKKPHQGAHHHGHISAHREVADALAFALRRQHQRRHGGRRRGAQGEDDAVEQAEPPHQMQLAGQVEACHDEEK